MFLTYTFTWTQGRKLATSAKGGSNISYVYNTDGTRISKTVDGVKHTYTWANGLLIAEEWGDTLLMYLYDENNAPIGFKYLYLGSASSQWDYYLFEKDEFGNIVAVYNSAGVKAAWYTYDVWGNYPSDGSAASEEKRGTA